MGILFAILAAICNSTIGIFSKYSLNTNSNPSTVVFFRCFFAFIVVTIILLIKKDGLKQIATTKKHAKKIFTTSIFGIFILYFFEICALSYIQIPIYSFLSYSTSILTIVVGVLWLKEAFNRYVAISIFFVIVGISLIFLSMSDGKLNLIGGIFAIIAGGGYSFFLILTRKFEIPTGFATLWWFFGFGTLLLSIPFVAKGIELPSAGAVPYIICLALIPTICGFYFTNKALSITEASRVQILEMSEPVFASILAFVFLKELMSMSGILGSIFIFIGIFIVQQNFVFILNLLNIKKKIQV